MNRQAAANNQERAQLMAEVIDLQEQRQRQEEARKAARREADAARRQKARDTEAQARRERFEELARQLEEGSKQWQRPQQPAPAQAQQPSPTPQQAPPTPAPALRQRRPSEPAPAAPRQPSPAELQAQREQAERERIERLSIDELSREIERLRPQSAALLAQEDEAVKAAKEAQQALEDKIHNDRARESWARETAREWRQAHPLKARAHDAGLFRSEFLAERETAEYEARQACAWAEIGLPAAKLKTEYASQQAEKRILDEQAPIRKRMAELQTVLDAKQARARVVRDFRELAAKRAAPMLGWADGGKQWEATPATLRALIDSYNHAPPSAQAAVLERLGRDPQASQQFKALLEQRQELVRQQGRGWSPSR
jgi:hypothetical protein